MLPWTASQMGPAAFSNTSLQPASSPSRAVPLLVAIPPGSGPTSRIPAEGVQRQETGSTGGLTNKSRGQPGPSCSLLAVCPPPVQTVSRRSCRHCLNKGRAVWCKGAGFGISQPSVEFLFFFSVALWPGTSYFTIPCLNFLMYKWETCTSCIGF